MCFGASGADCDVSAQRVNALSVAHTYSLCGPGAATQGVPRLISYAKKLGGVGEFFGSDTLKRLSESVQFVKLPNGGVRVPTSVGSAFHDSCCVAYPQGFMCNRCGWRAQA
jgi:hypothetical protein